MNLEAAVRWCADGTVDTVVAAKRADAEARHRIVRERLGGEAEGTWARTRGLGRIRTDPRAYFCWWELPAPWRAEAFLAAAAERGIAVTPGSAFAVGSASAAGARTAPAAVRIGLASPPPQVLADALAELAALAREGARPDARMPR